MAFGFPDFTEGMDSDDLLILVAQKLSQGQENTQAILNEPAFGGRGGLPAFPAAGGQTGGGTSGGGTSGGGLFGGKGKGGGGDTSGIGQGIGTVVGGLVGAYFGQPQIGAAVGGFAGNTIESEV